MNNYFTIEELVKSGTATRLGIDNTPTEDIIENLEEMINFLNPIREKWGEPILVNSGYRCKELNKAVGGSTRSGHLVGLAVDIRPKKQEQLMDLFRFISWFLRYNNLIWDELIIEHNTWIHLSINGGRKRVFGVE